MAQIKNRNIVFIILCALFVFAHYLRTCTAVIIDDLMKTFSVSAVSLGLMASAYFYAYGAMQIPVGFLTDRIGIRYTVFSFGLLGVIGSTLFAFSTNINVATLARLLTGIGTAGVWIPALKYLSIAYPPDEFATRTSIINAVGSLGMMFSALPMVLLVEKIGWRQACFLPGVIMLLLIVMTWYLMKPQTNSPGEKTKEEKQQKNIVSQRITTKAFYRHSSFWFFALWALIVYGVFMSFTSLWGVPYLQDFYNISKEKAGGYLMFVSVGMVVGSLFWGVLSDRFFRARRPVMFMGTFGLLLTWAAILFLPAYPGSFLISLLYFAIGAFSVVFIINLSCVKELFPFAAGTAMGAVNASMFVGVALFQGASGFILDYFLKTKTVYAAYRSIFILYLAGLLLTLLFVIFMPETFLKNKMKNKKAKR